MPLLVAAPFGMLSSFGWKFWTAHRQRAHLRQAISYFVPRDVVATLERNAGEIGTSQESTDCACVATDAANFTPLAETMTPEALTAFLNHYFEALFGHVADRGGFVSDVVGDAMLAIWPHRTENTHVQLLHALLEMSDAAQQFNEQLAGNRLLTRFGVDWGRVTLSTVGAHGHYEYRAVGDAGEHGDAHPGTQQEARHPDPRVRGSDRRCRSPVPVAGLRALPVAREEPCDARIRII